MLTILSGWVTAKVAAYVGGSIAAFLIAWVLKKIPNDRIKVFVGEVFYNLGVFITLGLSKWRWSAPYWQKIMEPWLIDLVDNVVGEAVKQFIKGLRSDN